MSRRECVYKRTGKQSVPFCERGRAAKRVTDFYEIKIGTSIACSDEQEVPGFKDRLVFDYRYFEMLEEIFGEICAGRLYRKIIEFNGGDVYRMLFADDRHKSRFNNFYKFALRNRYEIITSNKNIAAIFLLSANEYLWKQAKKVIAEKELLINQIDIHSDNEDVYDIYQAIRFILYGSDRLSIEDLAEPEIMKDSIVMLITNAFIVNKYGIEVLKNSNNITLPQMSPAS